MEYLGYYLIAGFVFYLTLLVRLKFTAKEHQDTAREKCFALFIISIVGWPILTILSAVKWLTILVLGKGEEA